MIDWSKIEHAVRHFFLFNGQFVIPKLTISSTNNDIHWIDQFALYQCFGNSLSEFSISTQD